jgi:hypothetical protein
VKPGEHPLEVRIIVDDRPVVIHGLLAVQWNKGDEYREAIINYVRESRERFIQRSLTNP